MNFVQYEDAQAFQARVLPLLLRHEAENNLPIGIIERGVNTGADDWFMACVEDEMGDTRLVALMTPPHNIILAQAQPGDLEAAMALLIESILRLGVAVPGVIAEKRLSHGFARLFTKRCGLAARVTMDERGYRLDRVAQVPLIGQLRKARPDDMFFLPYWIKGFEEECFSDKRTLNAEGVRNQIEQGVLYILEDGGIPVSMAGTTRQMPHGRAVGPVYTPPYLRGHGYATSAVAMLSRRILEMGNEYCALFADLANPTSNSIYQKIGYRPVCDLAQIRFEPAVN